MSILAVERKRGRTDGTNVAAAADSFLFILQLAKSRKLESSAGSFTQRGKESPSSGSVRCDPAAALKRGSGGSGQPRVLHCHCPKLSRQGRHWRREMIAGCWSASAPSLPLHLRLAARGRKCDINISFHSLALHKTRAGSVAAIG